MQKKKKKVAAAASLILMLSVLLSACTGADKQEESVTAGQTETGTAAAGDVGEETVTETETTSPESDLDRLKEWYHALEGDESAYYLWNKATGEGKLLQDGKYYTLDEEDLLVLYAPDGLNSYTIPLDVTVVKDEILNGGDVFDISLQKNVVRWDCEVEGMSQTVKKFDFTLVSSVKKEPDTPVTELVGAAWANFLTDYTADPDPVFLVWNDKTNSKEIIEEGETYRMQEGDEVALYYGFYYKADRVLPEGEYFFSEDRNYVILFSVLEEVKDQTEVTVTLSNLYDPGDVVELSCTLLPAL